MQHVIIFDFDGMCCLSVYERGQSVKAVFDDDAAISDTY